MATESKPCRRHLPGVAVDAAIGVLLFAAYGIIRGILKPFVRGFYCDDNSLKYPLKDETISTTMLIIIGTVIPIIVVLFVECSNHFCVPKTHKLQKSIDEENTFGTTDCKTKYWLWRLIERIGYAALGGAASQITTDIIKYMSGFLRPHFIAVCKPNATLLLCSKGYIIDDICTGDSKMIEFARKSFPSGHASFSAYSMVFIAIYLQYTIRSDKVKLMKPLSQFIAILLAVACSITRVTDYMHHPRDVIAGFLIGVFHAIVVIFLIIRLPEEQKLLEKESLALADNRNGIHTDKDCELIQVVSPNDGVKNYAAERIP